MLTLLNFCTHQLVKFLIKKYPSSLVISLLNPLLAFKVWMHHLILQVLQQHHHINNCQQDNQQICHLWKRCRKTRLFIMTKVEIIYLYPNYTFLLIHLIRQLLSQAYLV